MRKQCTAVIVAAGTAQRMQGIDKVLTPLAGVPVLLRSVRALAQSHRIDRIYIVTRPDLISVVTELCSGEPKFCKAVCGGSSRAESVLCGLQAVEQGELVAIHDGARPLATAALIDAAIEGAEIYGAAAPAVPVHDTIKRVKDHFVQETPDRSTLYAVQTPQVFDRNLIVRALQTAMEQRIPLTDDCSAAEALGMPVYLSPGSTENLKITVPSDLILAEAIIKEREGL